MRCRASGSASTSYSTNSDPFHSSHSRISCVCGQRAAPKSSSLAMAQHLQGFPNDVINRGLDLLNARDVVTSDNNWKVCQAAPLDLSPVVTQERDRQQVTLARFFECRNDVP